MSEATGPALDWLVAKCLNDDEVIFLGLQPFVWCDPTYSDDMHRELFQPAHRWAQGGPIIEREGIELREGNPLYFPQGNEKGDYHEPLWISGKMRGPTPLIAAMRCFVASKLGDTVGVPEELG